MREELEYGRSASEMPSLSGGTSVAFGQERSVPRVRRRHPFSAGADRREKVEANTGQTACRSASPQFSKQRRRRSSKIACTSSESQSQDTRRRSAAQSLPDTASTRQW